MPDKSKLAFPWSQQQLHDGTWDQGGAQGMTLREVAVIAAMKGMLANPNVPLIYDSGGYWSDRARMVAFSAVAMANHILGELEKPTKPVFPKIIDNDRGEIRCEMDGKSVRSWTYKDADEQREKMARCHEYVEGWHNATKAGG